MNVVSTCGDRPGVYPSCSRALARTSPNTNDSNGYYSFLGLYPWSSHAEIRAAARAGFKRWHPDGTEPDSEKFIRLKEIASTLLDPEAKAAYDSVPNGGLWIDSAARDALAGVLPEQLEAVIDEVVPPAAPEHPGRWDWFSDGHRAGDDSLACEWYDHLVSVAPLVGYTRTIKVMLVDADPSWLPRAAILGVPRRWRPSRSLAWALLSRVSPGGVAR